MTTRVAAASPRILLVDAGTTWRGAQRQLLLLAHGLRARGIEPLVCVPPRSRLLDECKRAGVATAVRAMRAGFDPLAVRGLRRLISTWHPALVHAHDPRSHALLLAALAARRDPAPLVVTRRMATPPRGRLRHGQRVARFIAITEAVRGALRDGGVADNRIVLVHPGVALPDVEAPRDWRSEAGWAQGRLVAGIVGPLTDGHHERSLEQLCAACAPALRQRAALVVLGGPATGRTELAGIPAYRAGFVHDVPAALAGLDLLLHPGGAEGLGTALVEGMALRVPAVAFATGGVGEIVVDGGTGLLAAPGDTGGFAAAVARIVDDESLRRRLAEAGPQRARQFSDSVMVERTWALYRELLGAPDGSIGG
ncbi:MAG: glycosyltransferase family 4 protein [Gemmatimonadaceae bacterium]|nr:glycosyltransferase family 4 protein [Gemmatimonadaceae bacterium]